MIFLAMASEESLMASLSPTLRVRLNMVPGLVPSVVVSFSPRDREGHVKQKVSRRSEPPLLMDVTLCVGVILPDDDAEDIVDEDDTDDINVDAIVEVSLSDCL